MNTKKALKILIVMEECGQFMYYKSSVKELLRRGHAVSVLFGKGTNAEHVFSQVKQFKAAHAWFESGQAYYVRGLRRTVAFLKRRLATYRRLLLVPERPRFYSDRVIIYLPSVLRFLVKHNLFYINFFIKGKSFEKFLEYAESKILPDKDIVAQLRAVNPDVLLVSTGNLASSSPESDYIKAAKAIGMPVLLYVLSWDHLETKVSIQVIPDLLLVWNGAQAEEAEKYHRIPRSMIKIVGSTFFDQWFDAHTPMPREAFCARYGLDPKKPILTYMSSSGTYGDEIEYLRKIYKAVSGLGIQLVVRPYPSEKRRGLYKRRNAFYKSAESSFVTFIPRRGSRPSTEEAAQLFYDTIYHSFAYIGICNSGMIDSMLIGRPGVTLLDDYYNSIQSDSPHFKQLLAAGALSTARDIAELRSVIENLRDRKDWLESKRRDFIGRYLRPNGINISAAESLADEIEKVAYESK